jgi:hypothetical protein
MQRPQSHELAARIDAELRERLEEAVDFACLEAMVARRRTLGLPAPVADDARDREEFMRSVRALLEHLRDAVAPDVTAEQRRKIEVAAADGPGDDTSRLLAVHVVLARELPDYWQRFEAGRASWAPDGAGSGGERRGLLDRLFGRG